MPETRRFLEMERLEQQEGFVIEPDGNNVFGIWKTIKRL